jgi:hypothetical protein
VEIVICKHITKRTYQKKPYIYCRKLKQQITFDKCKKCLKFESRNYKPINKRSSKLNKLERQRDKNLIKKGICECCGQYSERLDPHEIFGGSNRKRSIINNFISLICPKCHKDEEKIKELRKKKQEEFEKTHTREEFIKLIGKSQLD